MQTVQGIWVALTNAGALITLLPCIDYLDVLKRCSRRLSTSHERFSEVQAKKTTHYPKRSCTSILRLWNHVIIVLIFFFSVLLHKKRQMHSDKEQINSDSVKLCLLQVLQTHKQDFKSQPTWFGRRKIQTKEATGPACTFPTVLLQHCISFEKAKRRVRKWGGLLFVDLAVRQGYKCMQWWKADSQFRHRQTWWRHDGGKGLISIFSATGVYADQFLWT